MPLDSIKGWLKSLRGKPLDERLSVEFDEKEVRVRVLSDLDPEWNQTFLWSNVFRVCFKDGGLRSSDIVYLSLRDPEKVAQVPTEAKGGSEFFGEICDRGLMPEKIWRKAMGDTSGGMHCWPLFED